MNREPTESAAREAELVQQAQGGDGEAFGELVARYQDRIYNTCHRLCHNRADAFDLAQSTFLKALEALPRFEARASFYTWLYRIAVNLTLSHRRTQGRRRTVALAGPDDEIHGHEPATAHADAADHVEQTELQRQLTEALDQLDPDFRVAVVLKDIEGMDYATIAEILQVAVGTVKSRIHRGRQTLREILTAERSEVDNRGS